MPKRNGPGIELLADPTRRRIIAALALRARRPSSVAAEIGLSRAATSRQLTLMLDAGLVEVRRPYHDRRTRLYMIDHRTQGQIIAWLAGTEVGRPTVADGTEPGHAPTPRPSSGIGSPIDFSRPAPPTAGPPLDVRLPIDYEEAIDLDELLDFPDVSPSDPEIHR